jgi:hypothetical protein
MACCRKCQSWNPLQNYHPLVIYASKFTKQRELLLHVIFTIKLIIRNFYKQTTSNARPSNWAMHAPG